MKDFDRGLDKVKGTSKGCQGTQEPPVQVGVTTHRLKGQGVATVLMEPRERQSQGGGTWVIVIENIEPRTGAGREQGRKHPYLSAPTFWSLGGAFQRLDPTSWQGSPSDEVLEVSLLGHLTGWRRVRRWMARLGMSENNQLSNVLFYNRGTEDWKSEELGLRDPPERDWVARIQNLGTELETALSSRDASWCDGAPVRVRFRSKLAAGNNNNNKNYLHNINYISQKGI